LLKQQGAQIQKLWNAHDLAWQSAYLRLHLFPVFFPDIWENPPQKDLIQKYFELPN
jgi:hypothetical protein